MYSFIQNNLSLVFIAFTSGVMLLWSMFGLRLRGITEITAPEALQRMNHQQAVVLDVREDDEFGLGHILHARHIPLGALKERIAELDTNRNRPIIAVCRSGQRSASACAMLSKHGFPQASSLAGGMMAWQKAGLPTEK
jgi:rhodanese-related sulfurtransferase